MEMNMQLPHEGILLRVFIGETDKVQGKPLYEWIVLQAREQSLGQIEPPIKAGLVTREKAQIKFHGYES
jgi:hypothetical protein